MKTIKEIYNEIIQEKESFSSLDGLEPAGDNAANLIAQLQSNSKVALWRLMCYICAVAIYTSQAVLEMIKQRAAIGTLPWVVETAKNFQFGDNLEFENGIYLYDQVIPANRIVTNAAAVDSTFNVVVKVAKGTSPNLEPLTTAEFNAFQAYMDLKMIAGVQYGYVNAPADILVVFYDIFYNPLLMNSDGERISDGTRVVDEFIVNYIQQLPFNSVLKMTALTNAIKALPEVNNVVMKAVNARTGAAAPVDVYNTPGQTYTPFSGYMVISTDPNETLLDTINYFAG